jgi:hypothetical protein
MSLRVIWQVDTSDGGLLVSMGIIRHVVSASSALSWFIKYIYVWDLEFLKNVIY